MTFRDDAVMPPEAGAALTVSDWAAVVTAMSAASTAAVAFWQLRRIARDQHSNAKIQEAQFLLNLDQMYEGGSFDTSRRNFNRLMREAWEEAKYTYPENTLEKNGDNRHILAFLFSGCMETMYRERISKDFYQSIIKFMGFFETMGLFYKENLVSDKIIFSVYDSLIWQVFELCQPFIMDRRNSPNLRNQDYMRNFECLAYSAHRNLYRDDDRPDAPPWTEDMHMSYRDFLRKHRTTVTRIVATISEGAPAVAADNEVTQ